jgi:hypothetical protein
VTALVALAVLGGRRAHLHDFVLFLAIVIAIAVAVVAVFVITAPKERSRRL